MRILFVTRAAPIANGRGVDRRAAQHLSALRKLGAVTMVVSGFAAKRAAEHGIDLHQLGLERVWIRDDLTSVDYSRHRYWNSRNPLLRRIQGLRVEHDSNQRAMPDDAAQWRVQIGGDFDLLFAFRLASATWVDSVLQGPERPPVTIVDLDDIESIAHARISSQAPHSRMERVQTVLHTRWLKQAEAKLARSWTALCVCSDLDAEHLRSRFGIDLLVVPNAVSFPPINPLATGQQTEILFIGTLDYLPNTVGICWFANHVWPTLRARLGDAVSLKIAGMSPPPEVMALAQISGIEVLGRVEHLQPLYDQASIVIVPIFSGGGTRIKLIEALAHGRPVVTTSLGCEGLALTHGVDAMIADTPDLFAEAIFSLASDRQLSERIASNGWAMGKASFETQGVEVRFIDDITRML